VSQRAYPQRSVLDIRQAAEALRYSYNSCVAGLADTSILRLSFTRHFLRLRWWRYVTRVRDGSGDAGTDGTTRKQRYHSQLGAISVVRETPGYRQSMEADDLLTEVHEPPRAQSFPDLVVEGGSKPGDVSRLKHDFERSFPSSPFRLHHLW
jgi:hypothetical protein